MVAVTLWQLYHLSTGITLYISRSTVLSGNDITRPSVGLHGVLTTALLFITLSPERHFSPIKFVPERTLLRP